MINFPQLAQGCHGVSHKSLVCFALNFTYSPITDGGRWYIRQTCPAETGSFQTGEFNHILEKQWTIDTFPCNKRTRLYVSVPYFVVNLQILCSEQNIKILENT